MADESHALVEAERVDPGAQRCEAASITARDHELDIGVLAQPVERLDERERVLAGLQRADEQHERTLESERGAGLGGGPEIGPEARRDAVRDRDDALGREAVAIEQIAPRELGHRDDAVGAAHRARHESAEQHAITQREELGSPREAQVVHRHDGRERKPRRDEVLRVQQRRARAAGEARKRKGDAPVRGRDRERQPANRLRDVVGHRGGVAEACRERDVRSREGQLAQEVDRVRLIARPCPADGVRVDEHELPRAHGASSRHTSTSDLAAASQVSARRGAGRSPSSAVRSASAIDSTEPGSQ